MPSDVFNPDKIREAVQKELSKGDLLPKDKKVAIIAHVDEDGVSLVAAKRLSDGWTVSGIAGWDKKEHWGYGVNLVYSR